MYSSNKALYEELKPLRHCFGAERQLIISDDIEMFDAFKFKNDLAEIAIPELETQIAISKQKLADYCKKYTVFEARVLQSGGEYYFSIDRLETQEEAKARVERYNEQRRISDLKEIAKLTHDDEQLLMKLANKLGATVIFN